MIFYDVMEWIYGRFNHLLADCNLPFLLPQKLDEYTRAITRIGAALDNCFGSIDGTVRPICHPGRDQELVYNGHKEVHSLKLQCRIAK